MLADDSHEKSYLLFYPVKNKMAMKDWIAQLCLGFSFSSGIQTFNAVLVKSIKGKICVI